MILVLLADQNVVGLTAANLAFYILQRGASVPLPMQAGTHGLTGGETPFNGQRGETSCDDILTSIHGMIHGVHAAALY